MRRFGLDDDERHVLAILAGLGVPCGQVGPRLPVVSTLDGQLGKRDGLGVALGDFLDVHEVVCATRHPVNA